MQLVSSFLGWRSPKTRNLNVSPWHFSSPLIFLPSHILTREWPWDPAPGALVAFSLSPAVTCVRTVTSQTFPTGVSNETLMPPGELFCLKFSLLLSNLFPSGGVHLGQVFPPGALLSPPPDTAFQQKESGECGQTKVGLGLCPHMLNEIMIHAQGIVSRMQW